MLYAVRGLRDYWSAEARGYVDLKPDMTFEGKYDRDPGQVDLITRMSDRELERVIEGLMLRR